MAIVTIGSLLDEIEKYEISAQQYYASLRGRTTNDGVRLLTHYLVRRKNHLSEAMALLGSTDLESIRPFPVLVSEDQIPQASFFDAQKIGDSATADQLLGVAILITQTLLTFYETTVKTVASGPVHDFFKSLTVIEERAVVELKKIRAMNYF